jgi:hypothetical protein
LDIKLTQLPEASSSAPSDLFMVVQNGVNKKLSLTTLLKTLDSLDNIQINPSRRPIDFRISSSNSLNLFYIDGSADFIGIDTATPQAKFHVNGNIKAGSATEDGVVLNSAEDITFTNATDAPQGVGYFKPLNAARELSKLYVDTGLSIGQFDLGNGISGQYKTLTAVTLPSGAKATVKVTNGVGFNRIDFSVAGQSVVLRCITVSNSPKWVCLGSYLAVLYTV